MDKVIYYYFLFPENGKSRKKFNHKSNQIEWEKLTDKRKKSQRSIGILVHHFGQQIHRNSKKKVKIPWFNEHWVNSVIYSQENIPKNFNFGLDQDEWIFRYKGDILSECERCKYFFQKKNWLFSHTMVIEKSQKFFNHNKQTKQVT